MHTINKPIHLTENINKDSDLSENIELNSVIDNLNIRNDEEDEEEEDDISLSSNENSEYSFEYKIKNYNTNENEDKRDEDEDEDEDEDADDDVLTADTNLNSLETNYINNLKNNNAIKSNLNSLKNEMQEEKFKLGEKNDSYKREEEKETRKEKEECNDNGEEEEEEDEDEDEDEEDTLLINKLLHIDSNNENDNHASYETLSNLKSNAFDKASKEVRGRPSACVFVASLSSNISDDILCQSVTNHFKQWGQITLVKVLRDPANRPYAFVQYFNDDDADKAIAEGQHSILNGRTVRCEKARVNRTLYLELKKISITKKLMKKILSRFGEIERLVAVDDNFDFIESNKQPNRNWFCKYVFRQDAIGAFATLKSKPNWNVEWAQNLEDEYKNIPEVTIDKYSVFVGHLDPRISKDEMLERFEKHGKIKEAILVNRPLSNFAFIKFTTKEAAAAAVEYENHSMFKFKTIHVQYRELYNNFRRKYSNDIENDTCLKLNLAPPPVNFKRRSVFHANKNHNNYTNNNKSSYYYNKNNSYFDDINDNAEISEIENNIPKTFSQVLKLKHSSSSKANFSNNYNGKFNNSFRFNKSQYNNLTKKQFNSNMKQPQNKIILGNIINPDNNKDSDILVTEEIIKHDYNSENKENIPLQEAETNVKIDVHSLHENDIDNDSTTIRSTNTYSSAGPKTGYTFSSIDNAEIENPNVGLIAMPNNHQYQYPCYYYYPPKCIPYMNSSQRYLIDSNANVPNVPQSSNVPYFYAYSNYTPGTPNAQMPHLFPPVYYYYNSAPIMDYSNEVTDQQFQRNDDGNTSTSSSNHNITT